MPHQHHFLSRLDRLSLPEVELALSLYRDAPLVKHILAQIRLPERAERVALSLGDPVKGPFLVVAREGVFVTCLGKGMSTGDLTVVPRTQLDGIITKAEDLRSRVRVFEEVAGEHRGMKGLFERMHAAGSDFSREEMVAISALQPLFDLEILQMLYGTAMDLEDSREMLLPHLRRANKLKGISDSILRKYWSYFWLLGHLSVLTAMEGPALIERMPEGLREHFVMTSYSWGCVRQGFSCTALRGVWGAARLGKAMLPLYKKNLHEANTTLTILDATMGITAIGLRHSRTRAEVEKALAAVHRRKEEGGPFDKVLSAAAGLMEALLKDDPEQVAALRDFQRGIGARAVMRLTRSVPKGSPFAFEREEDVPEDLALTAGAHLDLPILNDMQAQKLTFLMLPWVAKAAPEDLYLPRDFIRAVRAPWKPADTYLLLRSFMEHYPNARPRPEGPTRNGPCPCGSGKKFKRCCGETADA